MSGVWVALIVAVVGPVLLSWLQGRQRRAEKQEDHEREDAVADRLLKANERVAEQSAEASKVVTGKLDVIHTLVNSSMTAAMKNELDATVSSLALMKEVMALKKADARFGAPSPEVIAAVNFTQAKISELQAALSDRLKGDEVANEQAARTNT